jgi:RNA polymerase sigma factor (sigma-70 family)
MDKDKFKHDVESYEEFPKHFLADTIEEAEDLYKDHYSLLNNISYTYSFYSNVSKSDLFGEALIGLARANRDYEDGRGAKFKTFAIYKIKTVLNEYVRKNSGAVVVPAYIKHASRHLELLKSIFKAYDDDSLGKCLEIGNINDRHLGTLKPKADEAFRKLKGAAERAGVSTEELARRIEFMPVEIQYDDYLDPEDILRGQEDRLHMVLLVDNIKQHLTGVEKEIVDCIMDGMAYNKIAKRFNKSTPWIRHQLDNMRDKLKEKMGGIEFDS